MPEGEVSGDDVEIIWLAWLCTLYSAMKLSFVEFQFSWFSINLLRSFYLNFSKLINWSSVSEHFMFFLPYFHRESFITWPRRILLLCRSYFPFINFFLLLLILLLYCSFFFRSSRINLLIWSPNQKLDCNAACDLSQFYWASTFSLKVERVWLGKTDSIRLLRKVQVYSSTSVHMYCPQYWSLYSCADSECTTPRATYFPQLWLADIGLTLCVTANDRLLFYEMISDIWYGIGTCRKPH